MEMLEHALAYAAKGWFGPLKGVPADEVTDIMVTKRATFTQVVRHHYIDQAVYFASKTDNWTHTSSEEAERADYDAD